MEDVPYSPERQLYKAQLLQLASCTYIGGIRTYIVTFHDMHTFADLSSTDFAAQRRRIRTLLFCDSL